MATGTVLWQLANVLWQLANVLWQLGNVLWQLGNVLMAVHEQGAKTRSRTVHEQPFMNTSFTNI